MAFDLSSIKRNESMNVPRVLLYSAEGMGKTTFCAEAPHVIFIQTEDGLGNLDVPTFPLASTYEDVITACSTLYKEEHPYRTLAVDSLDHLELLIWDRVCRDNQVPNIEAIGFGKGYIEAMGYWRNFFQWLNALRDHRQMMILCTAHSQVNKFDAPDKESYDRYEIKLHRRARSFVIERFDCVLFADHNPRIKKEDMGFGKKRIKIVGSERVIYTTDRPSAAAKNRYNLPEIMPLAWSAFQDAMTNSAGMRQIQEAGGKDLPEEDDSPESEAEPPVTAPTTEAPPAPEAPIEPEPEQKAPA